MENRQIILTSIPEGALKPSHFEMRNAPMPEPGENEILVKTLYMSLDAANRAWMQGPSYRDAVVKPHYYVPFSDRVSGTGGCMPRA